MRKNVDDIDIYWLLVYLGTLSGLIQWSLPETIEIKIQVV